MVLIAYDYTISRHVILLFFSLFFFVPTVTSIGVYFTKFCKDTCDQLGLSGWVKNSKKGTIVGKVQGEKVRIDEM